MEINTSKGNSDRHHDLPMARIKKIMKMDDSVLSCVRDITLILMNQMIGSDAPVVIAKACELFIRELTLQAWINTEENKRRTLQVCLPSFFFTFRKQILQQLLVQMKCMIF